MPDTIQINKKKAFSSVEFNFEKSKTKQKLLYNLIGKVLANKWKICQQLLIKVFESIKTHLTIIALWFINKQVY